MEATTTMDGMALQQEISSWNARLLPELETLFDRYAGMGRHIRLDRLEVTVESAMEKDWTEAVIKRIMQAIELELEAMPGVAEAVTTSFALPGNSDALSLIEQWLYFLEHGYLPWYGTAAGLSNEVKLLEIIASVQQQPQPGKIQERIQSVLSAPAARKRLLSQFSAEVVMAVIGAVSHAPDAAIKQVLQQLEEPYIKTPLLRKAALDIILNHIVQKKYLPPAGKMPVRWRKEIKALLKPVSIPEKRGEYKDLRPEQQQATTAAHKMQMLQTDQRTGSVMPEQKTHTPPPSSDIIKKLFAYSSPDEEEAECIYIENAGLVIAAPFLGNFLQRCGLIRDGALTDPSRAVCLLQCLVNGSLAAKEYELSLNKILCGLDMSDALNECGPVTAQEAAEAEQLLAAIIKYWTIIKNTSIEGLRESFLQRNGKLSRKGDDWLLQVEQKPYDMLLEHLPWTISLIRLSFMQCSLYVEWI